MSYLVSEISLGPISGVHQGTGSHAATNWVVDPASVPGSGDLMFTGLDVEVTTKLFAISDEVVPNWFGVALPRGVNDFTRPHLFFHPTPGQAHYIDADYPTKAGLWPQLFYYMERLGYQLDGARRNQVLIMPFMTEAQKDCGILVSDWQDILTQILTQVRAALNPADQSTLSIDELVVSSFSAGMIYSYNFRQHGDGVGDVLSEVWDFDGRFSTYNWLTAALQPTPTVQVIKYDQVASQDMAAYHVPLSRWSKLVNPPTSNMDVHALIRDFMFLHAANVSSVGTLIPGPASGPTNMTTGTLTAGTDGTLTFASGSTLAGTGTPMLPGGPGDSATGAITAFTGIDTASSTPEGSHSTLTFTTSSILAQTGTTVLPGGVGDSGAGMITASTGTHSVGTAPEGRQTGTASPPKPKQPAHEFGFDTSATPMTVESWTAIGPGNPSPLENAPPPVVRAPISTVPLDLSAQPTGNQLAPTPCSGLTEGAALSAMSASLAQTAVIAIAGIGASRRRPNERGLP